eukprot:6116002-Alexandrium_andersonii.AAC.1
MKESKFSNLPRLLFDTSPPASASTGLTHAFKIMMTIWPLRSPAQPSVFTSTSTRRSQYRSP